MAEVVSRNCPLILTSKFLSNMYPKYNIAPILIRIIAQTTDRLYRFSSFCQNYQLVRNFSQSCAMNSSVL